MLSRMITLPFVASRVEWLIATCDWLAWATAAPDLAPLTATDTSSRRADHKTRRHRDEIPVYCGLPCIRYITRQTSAPLQLLLRWLIGTNHKLSILRSMAHLLGGLVNTWWLRERAYQPVTLAAGPAWIAPAHPLLTPCLLPDAEQRPPVPQANAPLAATLLLLFVHGRATTTTTTTTSGVF